MTTAAPAVAPPALPATRSLLREIVRRPHLFIAFTFTITVCGLALDHYADLGAQMLLALCTWVFLGIAFVYLTPMERAQTSVVVVVATCAEIIGSVIWGVYVYRLGNLPLFVPPGHGFVYLTGLQDQPDGVGAPPRPGARADRDGRRGAWALLGLVALGRVDAAGAFGAAVLLLFLWRGRAPTVYAGVFLAVAFLEIYGTAVGTWQWAAEVPGLGVPDGNPPSGAASGYVFFDIAAIALAPWLLQAWSRLRALRLSPPAVAERLSDSGRQPEPPLHSPEVAGQSITGEISLLWQDRDPYAGDVLLMSLDTDEPFRMNTFEIRGGLAERLKDGVLAEGMRVRVECRAETIEVVNVENGETSDEDRAVVIDVIVLDG